VATTLDVRRVVGLAAFTVEKKGEEKARRVKSIVERDVLYCILERYCQRDVIELRLIEFVMSICC
jgi:hypothetical protein